MLSMHKPLFVSVILASLTFSSSWSADMGKELIELSGVRGGLVVVLNDEQLISEIRPNDRYLVQGLFKDEKSKTSARKEVQSKGIYGRVTVRSWKLFLEPF